MQSLKTAIVQTDLIWQQAEENRNHIKSLLNTINDDVDIIVLPEMFTTGFTMKPQEVAEQMNGETVQWMQAIALELGSAICGSIVIIEDNNFYNRFIFVSPSGEIQYYNKRHLFSLAGEDKVFTKGLEKVIVNYKGWKICPQICYDLRFPVWTRNVENYDLLLYVANWPKSRTLAWDTLLQARAIENMCYTIGVNRVGKDANDLEYIGHSVAYNCLGEQLTKTKPNKQEITIVTLDKNHIKAAREKLQFLNDKDSFKL